MTINPKVIEILQQLDIDTTEGILYLTATYYKLPINEALEKVMEVSIRKVNLTKIVERDYEKNTVKWNVPLYLGEKLEEPKWFWVDEEYRKLFKDIRPDRAGTSVSCLRRMKDFFRENPEVRKEDIMEATKLYIQELDNPEYLQGADYFIKKGVGVNATSRLTSYLERIKVKQEVSKSRNLNLMQ